MRKLAMLITLGLVLAVAVSVAAQDKQDKDSKGALGGVLDTLGSVLGTGPQKLHGTVVVTGRAHGATLFMTDTIVGGYATDLAIHRFRQRRKVAAKK